MASWLARTIGHWRLVASTLGITLVAAVLAVLIVPPVYRSKISFVANSSANKMQSAIGGSGALAGLASQFGVQGAGDPSESPQFYIELIQSRELLTRLLDSRFRDPRASTDRDSATLLSILHIRTRDPQRKLEIGIKQMSAAIRGNFDTKTNLVWLTVDARWPALSAAVANRSLELVAKFNQEQRTSRMRSKRVFLEARVDSAQTQLRDAEEKERIFYEENRLWRNSPGLVFAEGQLRREVDIDTDLYLTLKRQLEMARIDEFNDAALITVVDSAVPPRKAQWPRYGLLSFSALFVGLLLGGFFAGSAAVFDDWRDRNPDRSTAIGQALRNMKHEIGRPISRRRKASAPN
jgi:uncharacterized protein involved in exopolysaccharide biosynthesis